MGTRRHNSPTRRLRVPPFTADVTVDCLLYTGDAPAVREFVGSDARVLEVGMQVLVLDGPGTAGEPLTAAPGCLITRCRRGRFRISVSPITSEDDETP